MGLDMYLSANRYVSGFSHNKDKAERSMFNDLCKTLGVTPTEEHPSISVSVKVGYWRKANAIHAWFVKNVQNGKDKCQDSDVSREELAALRDQCKKVLADPNLAGELLPTQSGFFFGSTDYGEYYLTDLRDTVAIIDQVLNDPAMKEFYFSYRSSW